MAFKQAGRGHEPGGIEATSKGELTVECPACPHPGRNLPGDWEKAGLLSCVFSCFPLSHTLMTHSYRFLYILYLSIDGNFKLKGKERNINDIELMPGLGAFVTETDYKSHIANYVDQLEVRFSASFIYQLIISMRQVNTCESRHDALVRAATRSTPGYSVSGAVVVICSRHCLVCKNGAGDLQLGEK